MQVKVLFFGGTALKNSKAEAPFITPMLSGIQKYYPTYRTVMNLFYLFIYFCRVIVKVHPIVSFSLVIQHIPKEAIQYFKVN